MLSLNFKQILLMVSLLLMNFNIRSMSPYMINEVKEAKIYANPMLAVAIIGTIMETIDDMEKTRYNKSMSRKINHITNTLYDIKNKISAIELNLNRIEKNTITLIDQNNQIIEQNRQILSRIQRIEQVINELGDIVDRSNLKVRLDERYEDLKVQIKVLKKIGEESYQNDIERTEELKNNFIFVIENEFRPERYVLLTKFSEFLNVACGESLDPNFTSKKFIDFYFRNTQVFDTVLFEKKIENSLIMLINNIENNSNGNCSRRIKQHNIEEIKKTKKIRNLEIKFSDNSIYTRGLQADINHEYNYLINNIETLVFLKKLVIPDIEIYLNLCIKRNNYALLKYYIDKKLKIRS